MRQLLSFFVIALLLLSHSVVGDAAPHVDGSIHGHSHDMADVELGDHEDYGNLLADSRAVPDSPNEPVGQASGHTHLPGAVLPDADVGLASRSRDESPALALVGPSLVGRGTAPLIEPPSV